MKYLVNPDQQIEFSFGSGRYPFELVFDVPALRHFMELAGDALEQVAIQILDQDDDAGPVGDEGEAGAAGEESQP